MDAIAQCVIEARHDALIEAVLALPDKERRALQPWVKAWWPAERERQRQRVGHERYPQLRVGALMVAVLAAKDAAQALSTISVEMFVGAKEVDPVPPEARAALVRAVAHRGRAFAADFVQRCAVGKRRRGMFVDVLTALIDAFELALPDDGEFLELLARDVRGATQVPDPKTPVRGRVTAVRGSAVESPPQLRLGLVWAADGVSALSLTFRPQWLLHTLCAQKDGCKRLFAGWQFGLEVDRLCAAVTQAVEARELQPEPLADDLLGALLRGDSAFAQRLQARLLAELQPHLPERARWLRSNAVALVGLLASGEAAVAAMALELLQALDAAGPLEATLFGDACAKVSARKEKGLRDALLAWGLRRAAPQTTLPSLLQLLQVDDYAFKKAALPRLRPLWDALDDAARASLRGSLVPAAAMLEPDLAAELARWAGNGSGGPAADRPPSRPAAAASSGALPLEAPQPFLPVEASDTALTELAAVLGVANPGVMAIEQSIDVAVRLQAAARGDGDAPRAPEVVGGPMADRDFLAGLRRALAGRLSRLRLDERDARLAQHGADSVESPAAIASSWLDHAPLSAVWTMRTVEIEEALARNEPHPLLSRPSFAHGGIAAADLVERLRALAGRPAPPLDLLVALMRTAPCSTDEIEALRAIGSEAAQAAAGFLAAGGIRQAASQATVVERREGYGHRHHGGADWDHALPHELAVTVPPLAVLPAIPGVPLSWARGVTPTTMPDLWQLRPERVALLAENGDLLAALHLWGFRKAAGEVDRTDFGKDVALRLPDIVACRGPAGAATHLALLYAMSATDAGVRIVAVDGLLALIAQRRFDAPLCAALLAQTLVLGSVKVTRLAGVLAQAADALEGRAELATCWTLAKAALAAALAMTAPPPGSPDLVALATRLANALGRREPIDGLAAMAARKGSGKLVLECRRLQALLDA